MILEEEREERNQNLGLMSWSLMLNPVAPPQTRGAAATNLIALGNNLNGIHLDCETFGKTKESKTKCDIHPRISNVNASNKHVGLLYTDDLIWSESLIENSEFNIYATGTLFEDTSFWNSSISMQGSVNAFLNSEIIDSVVRLDPYSFLSIGFSNVSGSCFSVIRRPSQYPDGFFQNIEYNNVEKGDRTHLFLKNASHFNLRLQSVWAYADNPPVCRETSEHPLSIAHAITLCDPQYPVYIDHSLRGAYRMMSFRGNSDLNLYDSSFFVSSAAMFDKFYEDAPSEDDSIDFTKLGIFRGCKEISLSDALKRFPNSYP
ncbi:hypothetical protein [Aurantimonas coralicida]